MASSFVQVSQCFQKQANLIKSNFAALGLDETDQALDAQQ